MGLVAVYRCSTFCLAAPFLVAFLIGFTTPPQVTATEHSRQQHQLQNKGGHVAFHDLFPNRPPQEQHFSAAEDEGTPRTAPVRLLVGRRRVENTSKHQRHLQEEDVDDDTTGDNNDKPAPALPDDPTPAPDNDATTETPAPTEAQAAAESTPHPTVQPTPAITTRAPTEAPTFAPVAAVEPTPAPEVEPTPSPSAAPSTRAPVTQAPSVEDIETAEPAEGGGDQVATPYFMDTSTDFIVSFTFHVKCDTEGATIHYTLDGTDPSEEGGIEVAAGDPVFVHRIGTVTIRAVGTKEGMADSEEITKTATVQDRVSDPVLSFEGERDATANPDAADNTFLRTVTITMNCSTPNATLHYTTDGVSYPGDRAPSVAPGTQLQWSEEGTTEFSVVAFAEGWYKSEETEWEVTIVAPTTDEHAVAEGEDGSSEDGMRPLVEVTAFEAVYAASSDSLEQEEQLGPGYGEACDAGARVVRGKLLRVLNPSGHLSFAPPLGACGSDEDAEALSLATETARDFSPIRKLAARQDGESPEEARVRLGLDEREAAWRAAGGLGCQVAAAGGLLGGVTADAGGCVVGHLVGGGQVYRAEEDTGLVSFGVRGGRYVVGVVSAVEVLDDANPFENLISGAGWLVRAGVNHVEASAMDGHLDVLRDGEDEGGQEERGEGLDDVLTAKLARTAIGHDAEGRLILLQTSGAAAGADQDGSIPDGLDLSELADVLVEAGAVNAVNLVGGGPAAMTVNGSAVVDPAEGCSDSGSGGFGNGSIFPRCERAVSSIICVHLDPPPVIAGDEAGTSSAAPGGGSDGGGPDSEDGAAGGDDWRGSWSDDYAGGGGDDDVRLQWENDLCGNGTRNGTELWRHLDDVEEAVLRYKIAFWVVVVLGMISLYLNIQHHKGSQHAPPQGIGSAYGRQPPQLNGNSAGLIKGGVAAATGGLVEMGKLGGGSSKRGSKKSKRKGRSSAGGGYARVNADADWEGGGGGGGELVTGNGGVYGMDSEEEVDLGLTPSRPPSSRKRDKGKGRLRRALAKVSKGGGDVVGGGFTRAAEEDLDEATMAINPFGGGGGGGGQGRGREAYDEEGDWA